MPPSSPLGEVTDTAKPNQIYIYDWQRPCADVNSLYNRNAEFTQWARYINHYPEYCAFDCRLVEFGKMKT